MLSLSVNNLCLEFGDKTILNKVSFSLEENDKLGIIGVNGSGKTTLFKLICGEYEPTDGEVYISKGSLAGGDTLSAYAYGVLTEPGTIENMFGRENVVIKNANGEDVTENYDISYVFGYLTVADPEN